MLGRIGPLEVVVVLAIVLLIFGPAKLPGLAKAIGKSVVELKYGLKGIRATEESSDTDADNNRK